METIPYLINYKWECSNLKKMPIELALKRLSNLFDYKENQIISVSGLIELGKIYKVSSEDLEHIISIQKTEPDLFRLSKIISKMDKLSMIEDVKNVKTLLHKSLDAIYNEKYGR
ncbi:hypothetical protein [Riemerella anatipestifer]|uniref:hypothetical protein n=1 Tax=Riemerella anatipestifer TaxID=34085 RepID=UPI001372CA54|nr:hypothetical protein [Riemerella anatipestifer]MBT0549149.1 hypothetical protein [Riemerella anatipestifer]MBT0556146.1 hypothetical protein [Riemerella anatipestifer]MBT0559912.1 hypothetical protein [Riemerella anatipestifer]MDY3450312.1 hypothetical protein [Riemerella anatipestifer]NAV16307.1 hypothetical protein [Riemerella anatipestifer]